MPPDESEKIEESPKKSCPLLNGDLCLKENCQWWTFAYQDGRDGKNVYDCALVVLSDSGANMQPY